MEGSLPNTQRSNTTDQLLRKEDSFVVRSTCQETGDKAEICLPDPEFGRDLRGFSTGPSWTTDRSLLKGLLPASGFRSCLVLWFREGEPVRVLKCYL